MKRKDLLNIIQRKGCIFVRHGGNHDWYKNVVTGKSQPIPRHSEIEDNLSKKIIKRLSTI